MTYYTMQLDQPSNSMLKHFRVSPMAYHAHVTGGGMPSTPRMSLGSSFHLGLLEPVEFSRTFLALPSRELRGASAKESWVAECSEVADVQLSVDLSLDAPGLRAAVSRELASLGRTVMSTTELATMRAQVDSLNRPCHRLARAIIALGAHELELHWKHGILEPKAKLDGYDKQTGVLYDLKLCQSATADGFRRALRTFGYHFQAAYYGRALQANGHEHAPMVFLLSEDTAPYHWHVVECHQDDVDRADARTERDLARLQECIEKDEWPGLMGSEPEIVAMRRTFDE